KTLAASAATIRQARQLLIDLGYIRLVSDATVTRGRRTAAQYTFGTVDVVETKTQTISADGSTDDQTVKTSRRYLSKHGDSGGRIVRRVQSKRRGNRGRFTSSSGETPG
ncbi:MAG: hypothetical protein R3D27_15335, partial [Hyphomicrobiaceae bacterium]